MPSLVRAAARTGLVGGIALLTAVTTAPMAAAESRELEYSCGFGLDFGEGGPEGEGDSTAQWDSAISDDLTVPAGTEVSLDPFTGTIDLPEDFVDMLRDEEITSIQGFGATLTYVDETDEELEIEFDFGPAEVPATGPFSLEVQGVDEPTLIAESGTNTLVADAFFIAFGDDETYEGGMDCELVDEGDPTIDVVEGVGSAPTTTTAPTTTPVRPVVVQTDFAGSEGPSALPLLALGGAALAAAGAVALGRGARRAAARRH